MDKIKIIERMEDKNVLFFIDIGGIEFEFPNREVANGVLETITGILKKNGGIAKSNMYNSIVSELLSGEFTEAVEFIRSRFNHGKPKN